MSQSPTEDILATAAAWRAAGEQVAIATVTETWGSSPRPPGSQLAVTVSGAPMKSAPSGPAACSYSPRVIGRQPRSRPMRVIIAA